MAKKRSTPVKRLKENIDFIRCLQKAKNKKQRCAILSSANNEQIKTVCDCIYNVMLGNVSGVEKNKLRRHKAVLYHIIDNPRLPIDKQKIVLKQQGGFLPALLAPILGIAGSLIGSLINR